MREADLRAGIVLPPAWKPMDRHPRIRCGTWVPGGSNDKIVFCEHCMAIWHVVFAGSSDPPQLSLLESELYVLLTETGRIEEVWPILYRSEDFVRELLLGYFGGAQLDLSAVAQELVRRMRATDLDLQQAERLLQCLCSLLRGEDRPSLRPGSIAVPDLGPLLGLVDREDLFSAEPEASPYARYRIRGLLDDLSVLAFPQKTNASADLLVTGAEFRQRLLGMTGKEYRQRRAVKEMARATVLLERATDAQGPAEDRIRLNECIRHLSEALVEIEEIMWETHEIPDVPDLKRIGLVTRKLRALAAKSSWAEEQLGAVEREYREYLQRLLNGRQVPAECLTEVSAALGYHDEPGTAGAWETLTVTDEPGGEPTEDDASGADDEGDTSVPSLPVRVVRTLLFATGSVALVLGTGWVAGTLLAPQGGWVSYALLASGLVLIVAGGLQLVRIRR